MEYGHSDFWHKYNLQEGVWLAPLVSVPLLVFVPSLFPTVSTLCTEPDLERADVTITACDLACLLEIFTWDWQSWTPIGVSQTSQDYCVTPRPAREVFSGCQHLLHHWTWLAPAPCQRCTPSLPRLPSESQVLGGGGCVDDEQLRGVDDIQPRSSFSDQLVLQGGPPWGRPRKMEAPQGPGRRRQSEQLDPRWKWSAIYVARWKAGKALKCPWGLSRERNCRCDNPESQ